MQANARCLRFYVEALSTLSIKIDVIKIQKYYRSMRIAYKIVQPLNFIISHLAYYFHL